MMAFDVKGDTDILQMYDANVKLCRAMEWHPCLYDRQAANFQKKAECDAAWSAISRECGEPVATCKARWRNIRKIYTSSMFGPRQGAKSAPTKSQANVKHDCYLDEVLDFFLPHIMNSKDKASDEEAEETCDEDLKSAKDDVVPVDEMEEKKKDKSSGVSAGTERTKVRRGGSAPDANGKGSTSGAKLRSDRSIDIGKRATTSKVATFIIKNGYKDGENEKVEEEKDQTNAETEGDRRSRFKRACKRPLDPSILKQLESDTNVQVADKRPRRILERRKTLADCPVNSSAKAVAITSKKVKVRVLKTPQKKLAEHGALAVTPTEMVEAQLSDDPKEPESEPEPETEPEQEKYVKSDAALISASENPTRSELLVTSRETQCDLTFGNLDDDFVNSLKPQMALMNARQKLHFKKKVYQSLMETFDDGTNFPPEGDITALPTVPSASCAESTTSAEWLLMRELVALVQAAKKTPQMLDSNTSSSTQAPTEVMPLPEAPPQMIVDESAPPNVVKTTIPRHYIRKIMKVSGATGGTIMAQDGDKRRIFRIYPRGTHPAAATAAAAATSQGTSGTGTFYIPPPAQAATNKANQPPAFLPHPPIRRPVLVSAPTNGVNKVLLSAENLPSGKVTAAALGGATSSGSTASTASAQLKRTVTIRSQVPPNGPNAPGPGRHVIRRFSVCEPTPAHHTSRMINNPSGLNGIPVRLAHQPSVPHVAKPVQVRKDPLAVARHPPPNTPATSAGPTPLSNKAYTISLMSPPGGDPFKSFYPQITPNPTSSSSAAKGGKVPTVTVPSKKVHGPLFETPATSASTGPSISSAAADYGRISKPQGSAITSTTTATSATETAGTIAADNCFNSFIKSEPVDDVLI